MFTIILSSAAIGYALGLLSFMLLGIYRRRRALSPLVEQRRKRDAELVAQALIERGIR